LFSYCLKVTILPNYELVL